MNGVLHAYWWLGQNFGDLLTPYLIKKIGGKRAVWTGPGPEILTYMVAGSLLENDCSGAVIWGCGVMHGDRPLGGPREIRAVRGQISRDLYRAQGTPCPDLVGDPALVLPKVYQPQRTRRWRLGIVPHYVDLAWAHWLYGQEPGVRIVHVTDSVEQVIDEVCSCDAVVSSSLHGLAVADAYGVPCRWATFSETPISPIKFRDYWSAVGIKPYEPLLLRPKLAVGKILSAVTPRPITFDADRLLEACPFREGL